MKNLIFKIFALLLIVSSCSKDEKSPASSFTEEYRFFVKGQINGLPFEYNAGEDDYFLATDYFIEDSVVIMEGRLYRESDPGRNAITIRLRGKKGAAYANTFVVEDNIAASPYPFRDVTGYRTQTGKYLISFYGEVTTGSMSYYWSFPDNTSSTDPSIEKTIEVDENDPYPVTLYTSKASGCNSEVTHYVNLEGDCDATFEMELPVVGSVIKTEVISRIGTIAEVDWLLDGTPVTPLLGEIDLATVPGAEVLSCIVKFEDGCTKRIDRNLAVTVQNACVTDFWYTKEKPTMYDPHQYSTVEIEYLDENGKKFTSHYSRVEGDFKITSASEFRENEEGQKTVRFFMETDVILKNTDGSTIELKNGFGSFAVAHP